MYHIYTIIDNDFPERVTVSKVTTAHLLAAAPELLEALEAILTAPDYMIGQIARKAIAKARP